jgi:hypothetical protein
MLMGMMFLALYLLPFHINYKPNKWLRIILAFLVFAIADIFLPIFPMGETSANFAMNIVGTIAVASTVLFCFDEDIMTKTTTVFLAFCTENMSFAVFSLISSIILSASSNISTDYGPVDLILSLTATGTILLVYSVCAVMLKGNEKFAGHFAFSRLFYLLMFIGTISINVLATFFISFGTNPFNHETTPFWVTWVLHLALCILSFMIILSFGQLRREHSDLEITQKLFDEQKTQYEISKRNIDLVNQKCHDLKHQIRDIASQGSLNEEYIKEIEKSISIYDASITTGNKALDTILTEKSLYCTQNNIKFSSMVDGSLLSFVRDTDIYSLFGNALDNSIEAVSKLSDPQKRTIKLTVQKQGNFASISFINYFEGKISFDQGLSQTTKRDHEGYHGYGTKSIKMIAERYGGDISVVTEGNVFILNILLQCPKTDVSVAKV